MLIIPKGVPLKYVTAYIVQYVSDRKLFDHQMGGVIALSGLITSTDFKQISIDLKLVIIDFIISADSQP